MVLYTLGFNAIAPQSESTIISEEYVNEIYKRFNYIVVLFDNDKAGIAGANKYKELYGFNTIEIPTRFGVKDISDFRKKFKFRKT